MYTVDRLNALSPHSAVGLVQHNDIDPPGLQIHADFLFPDGFSHHGDEYFLKNSSHANIASPGIELLFEYVRRAFFPEKPSRFQSWFGVDSVDDAIAFRDRYCSNQGTIWRIESRDALRVNMALLSLADTTLVRSWLAHTYWRGEAGPGDVFWEYLLMPPVRVLEKIECG